MSLFFNDCIDFLLFNFHLGSLYGLLNILVLLVFVLLAIAITTLLERRLMSSMQRRRGPNFVGMFGFLQPFADGLKALIKENIVPRDADSFVFFLAPLLFYS
jgi:NADH:ubiquinone oxidoreductase subunit H